MICANVLIFFVEQNCDYSETGSVNELLDPVQHLQSLLVFTVNKELLLVQQHKKRNDPG